MEERLSRRSFFKLAAITATTGFINRGIQIDSKSLQETQPQDSKIEKESGWAQRDNEITIKINGLPDLIYYGSNVKLKGRGEILFGRNNNLQDAYRLDNGNIKGPYNWVHFVHINNEIFKIQVDQNLKPKFSLNPRYLYQSPPISPYEPYLNGSPDFYMGLLTVFSIEKGDLISRMYTTEPTIYQSPSFYPNPRLFLDVWEVLSSNGILRKGKNKIKELRVALGVNMGTETVAYLEEMFPLTIY